MTSRNEPYILVGDNAFHGINHLDQERARVRGNTLADSMHSASIVRSGLENGANGFMFSVSETTLGIVKNVGKTSGKDEPSLWPIVPYAYEYVRYAVEGGMPGLAARFGKQMVRSMNLKAILYAAGGFVQSDVDKLVRSIFLYELSRIGQSIKKPNIGSLMLHEVITDMMLALGSGKFFKSFVSFVSSLNILPGFETRNFTFLVKKFKEWNVDLSGIRIATPFNRMGFQMSPSREKCEEALKSMPEPNVVAMSVLAGGYLSLDVAMDYISKLPNLSGVVVGVSSEAQARQTFSMARDLLRPGVRLERSESGEMPAMVR